MDALADILFEMKDTLTDGILILPHILSGFFFFIGILTSNIGMLCIAAGHLILVPLLAYCANNAWPLFKEGKFNFIDTAKSVGALLVLIGIAFGPQWIGVKIGTDSINESIGTERIVGVIVGIFTLIAFVVYKYLKGEDKTTVFDCVNPYAWFNDIKASTDSQSPICFLSPDESAATAAERRNTPSSWTIHILFFFGFLLANAVSLYSQPVPAFKSSGDAAIDASRQEQLNTRVSNRKMITGIIIALSLVLLFALIYVRMVLTPCEGKLGEIAMPSIYSWLFGWAWYTIITKSCGIPASDILGLVQGFINPDAIDNPIVCLGST